MRTDLQPIVDELRLAELRLAFKRSYGGNEDGLEETLRWTLQELEKRCMVDHIIEELGPLAGDMQGRANQFLRWVIVHQIENLGGVWVDDCKFALGFLGLYNDGRATPELKKWLNMSDVAYL